MPNSNLPRAMHRLASQMTVSNFISVMISLLLTGCASPSSKQSPASKVDRVSSFQRRALLRELKRKQATIDELRDRNLILEKRVQLGTGLPANTPNGAPVAIEVPRPFEPSAQLEIPRDNSPINLPDAPPEPLRATTPSAAKSLARTQVPNGSSVSRAPAALPIAVESEQTQYEKVLEAYAHHDRAAAAKETDLLIQKFPDSIFADNALYLNGLLAVESHDAPRGMIYMNRVLREYPQGNKAVAALFAKSMLEKQGHQYSAAENDFNLLNKLYPGSPESKRVAVELKTMQMLNKKREM